jgi:prepilin-type N-terminal cleavage/methylation domain-containing protein
MKKEAGSRKKEAGREKGRTFPYSLLPASCCSVRSNARAFTLVEVLVGAAVFLVVSLAAYNSYISLFKLIDLGQNRLLAVSLANEQFEVIRNMPYSNVGVVGGVPSGIIPHTQSLTRGGVTFTVTTTVRNIDLAFDGLIGGSPADSSPADNKSIDIEVSCTGCRDMQPISLTGQIAPRNLETATNNGALYIRVFDANGQPVPDAQVHIVNVATTTSIVIDDVTDVEGKLQIVDLPPGVNAYRITVTKPGYSTDRTYPIGGSGNPLPTKADATVLLQQVTQASFTIDELGSINITSVTPQCTPVGNFDFALTSSKSIGGGVYKYSQSHITNSSGEKFLNPMEWDSYRLTPLDGAYDLAGINPLNLIPLNPAAAQSVQMVVIPKSPKSLLVTVKDSATLLPLSDATVTLTKPSYSEVNTTGKGYINQTDWSGGSGQDNYLNPLRFFSNDVSVDVGIVGEIMLRNSFGTYSTLGSLVSSTFDVGSASNFYTLTWAPAGQPPQTGPNSVRFQIATNASSSETTWDFIGPDGTAGSYYETTNAPLHSSHNGDRYLRYKAVLSTDADIVTPNISDVAFTYTSSCTPPGQVIFTGLASSTYTVSVSKSGYATRQSDVNVGSDWQEIEMVMMP